MPSDLLTDLVAHQEWADAEHWRTFATFPAALEDAAMRARLHHIHLVQHAFLSIVQGREVVRTRPEDLPDTAALRAYARDGNAEAGAFMAAVTPGRLEETLTIPWFRKPPISITVAQALAQMAMHSQHHRGQNATRLRELGGEPPTTDLIYWYWKERPAPRWDQEE